MKSTLALLTILGLLTLSQAMTDLDHKLTVQAHYGETDNWQNYSPDPNSIYVDVDYSHLGLEEAPFVTTFLTCGKGRCWTIKGVTSIYNLSKDGFRVYLQQNSHWTPQDAHNFEFALHYKVEAHQH